jgi:23S rRNA pseudouridine2605 synthase
MREGKNREVKNVLGHLGLAVNRLIRVSFGPFQLGTLPEGAVEEVKTRHLREQLGDKVMAQAGADFASPIVEREEPRRPPREAKAPERRPAKDDDRRPQRGDKARSDKTRGDKTWDDKPQGKRLWGDKPRSVKPQDDKPRSGKPVGKKRPDNKSRLRRRDEERFGGPELARRERRGRPFRSKGR